VKALCKKQTTQ